MNHAGSYYEQPDQYWVGNADLLGGVPVQCGLFTVLQHQNLASAFDREKAINSALKVAAFVVGLTLLCVSITTLPLYANQVGWAIPEEYADMFADLVIIGAVLIVSCKYIVEAFTKFKAILEVTPKNEIGAKYPDEK